MKFWRGAVFFCLAAGAFSAGVFVRRAAAQALENPSVALPPLVLDAGGIRVRVQPKNMWTIDRVEHGEHVMAHERSFYNLVIDLGGGKFVGSGHKEGGVEEVLRAEIIADGKAVDLSEANTARTISAKEITFTKVGKIAATTVTSVLRLNREKLEAEQFLTVDENLFASTVYAFMYAWQPHTTQWLANTLDKGEREGSFGEATWELSSDVRWTAIYDPIAKTAMLTSFAPNSQRGGGVKHGYWNRSVYHKQYYQPISKRELQKGEKFHWKMTLRAVPAEEANWKQAVREVAAKETIWQETTDEETPKETAK